MSSDVAHTFYERVTVDVSRDGWLWLFVGLVAIGDVVTTAYGLHVGLTESNPVASALLSEYGLVSLVGLKAGAVAIGYVGSRLVPSTVGTFIPIVYSVVWSVVFVINTLLITWVTVA